MSVYGVTRYKNISRALVVAQWVERLLPIPEIRGSNPNIGKVKTTNYFFKKEKTKIKKVRLGKKECQERLR